MTPSVTFALSTFIFEFRGRDARDLLHRIATLDVRNMDPGDFKPGFLLSAQGKIRASFRLACVSEDSFWIEIDGGSESKWRDEFVRVLDEMTFSEKVELNAKSDLKNVWIFGLDIVPENHFVERENVLLFSGEKSSYGKPWLSAWGTDVDLEKFIRTSHAENSLPEELERDRILNLTPKVNCELLFDSNPLEIGMRKGIADNKGCYPGQEVIEKIISLGSPAKRLTLLYGEKGAIPEPGAKVLSPEGIEVGVLSSVISSPNGGFSALTLLRKNVLQVGKELKIDQSNQPQLNALIERIADYE
ncbi:MAG: hypothetical protein H7301_04655 [Cryobacterium sp.]|nr:hypothetical protein [Oligoflexia bacterium]